MMFIAMRKNLFSISAILLLIFAFQSSFAQAAPSATQQPTPTNKLVRPSKKWQKPTTVPQQPRRQATTSADTVKNTDFSLNGQYQFMLSRSRSVNGYKLVNPYRLNAVWKSVTDTLAKERIALKQLKEKAAAQEKSIGNLQTEIKGNETTVAHTNAKIDEINVLGLSFTKGTYNIIVWSIIGVLTIALIVVVARSTKNVLEAKHRTQLYEEVSAEYQAFKAKSVEKERKLARELQDERNKIEEMKGRG